MPHTTAPSPLEGKIRNQFSQVWSTMWDFGKRQWLALIVAIGVLIYSFASGTDSNYWDGAIGNLLATLIGVMVGVPIALEIERSRMEQETQKQRVESMKRSVSVASLIKQELIYNAQRLGERPKCLETPPFLPFKDDLWQALSDSGEIRWINDPVVLNEVSSAYHFIGIVAGIEDLYYRTERGFNPRVASGSHEWATLRSDAGSYRPQLETHIDKALEKIAQFIICTNTS